MLEASIGQGGVGTGLVGHPGRTKNVQNALNSISMPIEPENRTHVYVHGFFDVGHVMAWLYNDVRLDVHLR